MVWRRGENGRKGLREEGFKLEKKIGGMTHWHRISTNEEQVKKRPLGSETNIRIRNKMADNALLCCAKQVEDTVLLPVYTKRPSALQYLAYVISGRSSTMTLTMANSKNDHHQICPLSDKGILKERAFDGAHGQ